MQIKIGDAVTHHNYLIGKVKFIRRNLAIGKKSAVSNCMDPQKDRCKVLLWQN